MSKTRLYIIGTVHNDPDGKERLNYLYNRLSPKIITAEVSEDRQHVFDETDKARKLIDRLADMTIQKTGMVLNPKQRATLAEICDWSVNQAGFEFKTAMAYCRENPKCRLELIDKSVYEDGEDEYKEGYLELQIERCELDAEQIDSFCSVLNKGLGAYINKTQEFCSFWYGRTQTALLCYSIMKERGRGDQILDILKAFEDIEPPEWMSEKAKKFIRITCSSKRNDHMAKNIRELYQNLRKGNMLVPVGQDHIVPLMHRLQDLEPIIISLADCNNF